MKKYLWFGTTAILLATAAGAGYYRYGYDDTGIDNLLAAAQSEPAAKIAKYLRINNPDLSQKDDNGYSVVLYALANSDDAVLDEVLSRKAPLEQEAQDGMTPLLMAVMKNNQNAVEKLLAAGADINHSNKNGWSPLAFAVSMPEGQKIAQSLMQKGANPNARVSGISLLKMALQTGKDPEIVAGLIAAGANVYEQDSEGNSLLVSAVLSNSNSKIIKILSQAGVDVNLLNAQKMSPLGAALYNGKDVSVVKALLDAGADVKQNKDDLIIYTIVNNNSVEIVELMHQAFKDQEVDQKMLLEAVKLPGREKVVEQLLNYDLDVNIQDQFGNNPLYYALSIEENQAAIEVILQHKPELKASNQDGVTALMQAAINYQGTSIWQKLLDAGADFKAVDKQGSSVLDYAVQRAKDPKVIEEMIKDQDQKMINQAMLRAATNPQIEILQVFATAKADPNTLLPNGANILGKVVLNPSLMEHLKFLLKMGAKTNLGDENGVQPLHLAAAMNSDPQVVKLLVDAKANVNAQDKMGYTPLMLTVLFNQNGSEVANVLLQAGANRHLKDKAGETYDGYLSKRQEAEKKSAETPS